MTSRPPSNGAGRSHGRAGAERHGETPAWTPIILHADMDAFYAAIEQLDDPKLRNRPVIVGPKSERGVVLTASYEARPFGVGSAMPMTQARARCPDALVVAPRFERYREVSAAVMAVFGDFSPTVEPISLDEAFLDMSGTDHWFGSPAKIGVQLKQAIAEATGGLTVSIGVSATKFVSKVASAYRKPDALTIVPPGEVGQWLAPQSVDVLWGAGPKTQRRLRERGFATLADVARADPDALEAAFGRVGRRFHALAIGDDPRPVRAHRATQSLSCERTLSRDLSGREPILRHLRKAADTVARRLRAGGLSASGVRIKLKRSDFRLLSRQRLLHSPTDSAATLYAAAAALSDSIMDQGPFRLVGIGAFELSDTEQHVQLDLVDPTDSRTHKLDRLLDEAEARFGHGAVKRARQLEDETVLHESPNMDFLDRRHRRD